MIKNNFLKLIGEYSANPDYNMNCWKEIEKNYTSGSRYYHTLEHLSNMINEMENVESEIQNKDALLFSIYYHDIIYKATKGNNEHQSALLFKRRVSKTSFPHIAECIAQIEATKEHKLSSDKDTNILLDLDLSILGASPEEYKRYCQNVRKEYWIYPNFIYKKGRKKALKHILELDPIYKTEYFKDKYEARAKENLKDELSQLS
ncbi:HD domain-containing protein [Mangrovivirga cuniculi]|uniref:Metal-dependent HD superfamily phosphohydrolase n=1 Tax=Mangrovivirga cuniculi TaxID=2715131 RepID=A0A4D7JMM5_9BACT|nr:hypothetical protein [Mangrovivirga cuniculi]QCK17079.1 hypothetical protein DCC35_13100 [Mangrovivirga cuniculi]